MSFLKRLFGGASQGGDEAGDKQTGNTLDYNGFTIRATPYKADGQFQTCGVISKEIDGIVKEHRFVRADRFASQGEAADMALKKGQQIVKEQGDRMFG